MPTIEEIIKYHQESDFVDFKSVEYTKEKKADLIKNILSLANSDYDGDRYIIIGVKKSGTKIDLFNIEQPTDSASIQQLVNDNIQRELKVEYSNFEYEGKHLAVLTIKNPIKQPYQAKKDIRKGDKISVHNHDFWIRKGSFQVKMSIEDFDRIATKKYATSSFNDKLSLTFENTESTVLKIERIKNLKPPSYHFKSEIEQLIKIRENQLINDKPTYDQIANNRSAQINNSRYQWDLPTLREHLKNADKSHYEDDLEYFQEATAYKIQLDIENKGSVFIYKCLLEIIIPKINGLIVRNSVFRKFPTIAHVPKYPVYPNVQEKEDYYLITSDLGDLRHLVISKAFKDSLRIVLDEHFTSSSIPLYCKIKGENLPSSVDINLNIEVK